MPPVNPFVVAPNLGTGVVYGPLSERPTPSAVGLPDSLEYLATDTNQRFQLQNGAWVNVGAITTKQNGVNGPVTQIETMTASLSPAAVAANTTAEQTFNPAGFADLAVGDIVFVNKPTAQAGLGIVGCRVSATGTLAITFSNNTAGSITPTAAETYRVGVIRP